MSYNNLNESLQLFDNEKRAWQDAIANYQGNDPLNLWFGYICWLETNVHLDTENQFQKCLERCLSLYEQCDAYKQDARMVKLWIKYIDVQPNPPNLYQTLYQRGIGTQIAAFYVGWAHYYDSANAFKQAESIFNLGLQTNAQPIEELRAAHQKFRMSIAQRMLYDDQASKKRAANSIAEQRQQITTLSRPQPNTSSSSSLNNSATVISSSLNFVYDETRTELNGQEEVVLDYESGIRLPPNHCRYARNHNEMWKPLLALEEPFDPNRYCHYPKAVVYPGNGCEYSLEEIKARHWYRRLEEIKERKRVLHQRQEEERLERQRQMAKYQAEQQRRLAEEAQRRQEFEAQQRQQQAYQRRQIDDFEDQIQASTIHFQASGNGSSGGSGAAINGENGTKRILMKFKKEKTINYAPIAATVEPPVKKKKKPKYSILSSYDAATTAPAAAPPPPTNGDYYAASGSYHRSQVEDANLLLSLSNAYQPTATKPPAAVEQPTESNNSVWAPAEDSNSEFNSSYGSFSVESSNQGYNNGFCSTPARSAATSRTSTPRSSYKTLRKKGTDLSATTTEDSMSAAEQAFEEESDDVKARKLEKAEAFIETALAKTNIDPFSTQLCRAFLTRLDFPSRDTEDCWRTNGCVSKFSKGSDVRLGRMSFYIDKEVGRGTYGAVFRAVNTGTKEIVALKYQKQANAWELYICRELRKRCTNTDMLPGFMHISYAVMAPNSSVLVSEFSNYGSLLDINNRIRTATTKVMHESLVMHFSSQILSIVEHLHACKIIHADIKPDNFLLMKPPTADSHVPTLRLIDFGCAIDMTLFPEDTQFKQVIQTDGFTCPEMLEGRPWSYQTDLFCVAGTIHVMLFGEYMQLNKSGKRWEIKQKLPRYLKKHVWTEVFSKLLNIPDIDHLPDLPTLRDLIEQEVWQMESELLSNIRTLTTVAKPASTTVKRARPRASRANNNQSQSFNASAASLPAPSPAVDSDSTLLAPPEETTLYAAAPAPAEFV